MVEPLDIKANRAARKWSPREMAGRLAWDMTNWMFALSPRQFWGWRCFLLRLFGASIGRGVRIFPNARIAVPWHLEIGDFAAVGDGAILYSLGRIRIGRNATISQYAHLCAGTHDYRQASFPLVKSSIDIGEGAWVCAGAFVGPGVDIGAYAILGAASVTVSNVPQWTIWAGNPSRFIKPRSRQSPESNSQAISV